MPKEQKKDMEVAATQAVKSTGRGGKYNFPAAIPPENPEDVKEVLTNVLYWLETGLTNRPKTDDEVEQRTIEYFRRCAETGERPTVESYCLALGYARSTVFDWESGRKQSQRRADIIKSAKETIAAYDSGMVTAGKMSPIPYIFRAKNYYGMKDQQDLVLTPNNPLGDEKTAEDIANAYKQLPE